MRRILYPILIIAILAAAAPTRGAVELILPEAVRLTEEKTLSL